MDSSGGYPQTFLVGEALRSGRSRRWIDHLDHTRPFRGIRSSSVDSSRAGPSDQRARILLAAHQFATGMTWRGYFSHTTAALAWGLALPHLRDERVHVSAPGRAPRAAGVIGHQIRPELVRVVVHPVLDLPVTDPASTWAMLGATLHPYDLVAAADAIVRIPRIAGPRGRIIRPALATTDELEAAIARGRRVGIGALRAALPRVRLGAASRPETWLRLVLVDGGLPEPLIDHDVYDDDGRFVGCVDLAYPRLRIAGEYEGDQHRTDAHQWQRDIEKYEQLADAGWRVVRIPRAQLFGSPETVVARMRAALSARR